MTTIRLALGRHRRAPDLYDGYRALRPNEGPLYDSPPHDLDLSPELEPLYASAKDARDALERIERFEPEINAFVVRDARSRSRWRKPRRRAGSRARAWPARRRARHHQGQYRRRRLADAARLGRLLRRALARRCAGHRPPARGRHGLPRQDDDAGIWLEGRRRFPAVGHHPQSLGYGTGPGRLVVRRCRPAPRSISAAFISVRTARARCAFRRRSPAWSA
jgi:hypothetical protein